MPRSDHLLAGPRLRKAALLSRWLGPWADAEAVPRDVVRYGDVIDGPRPLRAYRYEPTRQRATGTYLVLQGLHFRGPEDPRFDRFCRILAQAGHVVLAPFLPDYLDLRVTPETIADAGAAVDHAAKLSAERGLPRPALFSISFGSLPALATAADPAWRDRVGAVVVFGGYCDFLSTIRFSISGRAFDADRRPVEVPHDPLNPPAVFINLLPHLEGAHDPKLLADAWREMARRTWGQRALHPPAKRWPIAEAIAARLASGDRTLFMAGCGLGDGGPPLLEVGIARAGDAMGFTQAEPLLSRIAAPVVICHGRDDDVIPYVEAYKLRAGLRGNHPHRLFVSGLFGHTGSAVPSAEALKREIGTMRDMVMALVDAPHERLGPI